MYAKAIITVTVCAAGLSVGVAAQNVGSCLPGEATALLEVNNVRASIHNTGMLFWDGETSVYEVPRDSGTHAIFNANIWIGGLDTDGDLRFAGTTYSPFEYWPGPLDENGNPPEDCSEFDRLYSVYRADIEEYDRSGTVSDDLRDWPVDLGAPVIDRDGVSDNYNLEAGDRPDIISDQMVWWIMNDTGGVKEWSFTDPIGLEVHASIFAFTDSSVLDNTTFYRYRFMHKGAEPLVKSYFGIYVDTDLGYPTDDYVGSDSLLGMGYVFNGDDYDDTDSVQGRRGYSMAIPAAGIQLLDTPGDHPVTKFVGRFHRPCCFDSPIGNSDDPYNFLRGIWQDNTPMTYGSYGFGGTEITNYMFPSNPVKRAYWSEENIDNHYSRADPGYRRFLMSHGPFDLNPGDSFEIAFAIIWSQAGDRLASVARLLEDAVYVRGFYDLDFRKMDLIDAPVLSAVAGDQEIVLEWENSASSNNINESYDTRSGYLYNKLGDDSTYTFEGYDIFRFDSAADSVGNEVATYDIKNHLAVVVDEAYDYEQGAYIESVTATGENNGIVHSHVISNLTNYRDYHFGIQAYAYNERSWPKVIRSQMTRIVVTPGETTEDDQTVASLANVGITPNPYKGQSDYEVNGDSRSVRFTELPEIATIRVFTIAGTLVSEIEKNDTLPFYEWDLTTDEGRPLGGGVYLIHVSSPGLGERVIKFGHVGRER